MTPSPQCGPLAGIKVIDFGQYIAGPGAALMLADQGADVVRVDPPNGPAMPGSVNSVLNRGKKSIVLDLKAAGDLRVARALVHSADVVIENFRPGVMDRLGLGPQEMTLVNPGLVYLSLPGFSKCDKTNANVRAWEGVIAAAMGQFTDMGLNRVLMGIEASYSPLTLASAYASVFGALSVVLALRARLHHGMGDRIEVPLAAALMEGLAYNSMSIEDLPDRYVSLREREIQRRRLLNLPMNLSYEQLQNLLDPFYRSYRCRDGRPFYLVCCSHAVHAERALKVLGLWEEMLQSGLPHFNPYLSTAQWPPGATCTIRAYPMSQSWADRLSARMAEVFLSRDSFDWERIFGDAGVPGAAHRTTQEWIHSEHPQNAGLILKVRDRRNGDMLQPGPVAWLECCPPVAGQKGAPEAGEDEAEILATLNGASRSLPPPASPSQRRQGWTTGLTILDLTNVIAGPTIAGTLARFGAKVIKVDPPWPAYDPHMTIIYGIYANRGKASVLADLKRPGGRDLLKRLVPMVDIITINATSQQLPSLGLTFENLRRLNPRVILCHLDAFGGPQLGPRSDYRGYDDMVQASTGIMARFGGSLATVEEHAHIGTIDVLAGLCGAFASSLALWRREQTGMGDIARTSLAAAGQWLQSRFLYDFAERPPFDEARGREAKGEGSLYRCYRALDGWVFFAARETDIDAMEDLPCMRGIKAVTPSQRELWLTERFARKSKATWVAELSAVGVAVQPLENMSALRDRLASPTPNCSEMTVSFVQHKCHPSGHQVEHIVPTAVRVENAAIFELEAAEKFGKSTRSVAQLAGYTTAQIDELLTVGDIGEQWTPGYLPT
jgi:crotonobetainyl-CoA:carnitine CoA-transferase CaiB-like acyl-CoA transferase